jgi:hypothetical protein
MARVALRGRALLSQRILLAPQLQTTPGLLARNQSTDQAQRKKKRSSPRLIFAAVAVALTGATVYASMSSSSDAQLNDTTFTPYTITAREAISPTSFVFTVSPNNPPKSLPYLSPDSPSWRYPLWSVEFKQPEVQIARHYTPLPPQDGDDPRDGTLRFYVRAIGDGEMSNYLSHLREGQNVFLRGPHQGFDVLGRLGTRKQLVVLTGGTGLVPGMQAVEAVLTSGDDTTSRILWAVRKREEVQQALPPARSSWWSGPEPRELQVGLKSPSPVARQLEKMKKKFGDRLQIHIAVDEEKSTFSESFLASTLKATETTDTMRLEEADCRLHSQSLHRAVSEFEPQAPSCDCAGPGKNLLLVSGPDGFITHYAGPKVWLGGLHTQGPVDGMVRQIQARDSRFKSDWLVLKL